MTATARQIGKIHALKKSARLDDDSYRDVLDQVAGVRSAKGLTVQSAIRVIDRLQVLAGEAPPPAGRPDESRSKPRQRPAEGALALSGPFAGKLRALWITAHNLGVVDDRRDTALAAFVERQTGLSSPNWLNDPAEARRVIEALKSWIAREAGFAWPSPKATAIDLKRAVLRAQWARLLAGGAPTLVTPEADLCSYCGSVARGNPRLVATLDSLTEAELDRVAPVLGAKLRKALAGSRK